MQPEQTDAVLVAFSAHREWHPRTDRVAGNSAAEKADMVVADPAAED